MDAGSRWRGSRHPDLTTSCQARRTLRLVTLGGLRLDGVDFRRRKPLLWLAYLIIEVLQPQGHLAERCSGRTPRTRWQASGLRSHASGRPRSKRSATRHHLATDVTCDATALLASLERTSETEPPVTGARPFLNGLYLKDVSTELEEWIYGTREFIAQRLRGALLTHAERLAARNDRTRSADATIAALDAAGAGPADPEDLQRAHPILLAARHERARAVAHELREYGPRPKITASLTTQASRHDDKIPTNLTTPTTTFIGREAELRTIHDLLEEGHERLITLLGTAGVGKTRLSIQAAHEALASGRHSDGVYWVGLDARVGRREDR